MIVKSEGQRDQMFWMYLLVNQEAFNRGRLYPARLRTAHRFCSSCMTR